MGRRGRGDFVAEHVESLLGLPTEVRDELSVAFYHPFTRESPAPPSTELEARAAQGPARLVTVGLGTLETGALLAGVGCQPAVLNMANEYNCGGGWCAGFGSQEEELFWSSTLPLSLWPLRRSDDDRLDAFAERWPRSAEGALYPLSEAGVIYSPRVTYWRQDGALLPEACRVSMAVVSAAAQDLRAEYAHYQGPWDTELTREKARSLLWAAASRGHDALVLGAWGCGAFRNDPRQVADVFSSLLKPGAEFSNSFKLVVFAVIKSRSNFQAFASRFPPAQPEELRSSLRRSQRSSRR